MSRDEAFSFKAEYIHDALEGKEENIDTLNSVGDYNGDIELVLTGSIEDPLITNSHVAAANLVGRNLPEGSVDIVSGHAASELRNLHNKKGQKELRSRMRNIHLNSVNQGGREKIDWNPKNIVFHPPRVNRDDSEIDYRNLVRNCVTNLASYAQEMRNEKFNSKPLIENVAATYDPPFLMESVEDARVWKDAVENLPDFRQDLVGFVVDVAHTDYPNEMLEILNGYVDEIHVHNRVPTEGKGERGGDDGEFYEMHRPPLEGEIDMYEISETVEDISDDPLIVYETGMDYLTSEVVEDTYESDLF